MGDFDERTTDDLVAMERVWRAGGADGLRPYLSGLSAEQLGAMQTRIEHAVVDAERALGELRSQLQMVKEAVSKR